MKVYTRTGDQGQTSLASGERVAKTHPRLEAYGTLDELSSHIGLLLTELSDDALRTTLLDIQRTLFEIGARLASTQPYPLTLPVAEIEAEIDALAAPWRGFTLPGGCRAAAQAHVCRTVCRRFERRLLALPDAPTDIVQYANRLSDFLYVLALHLNKISGREENYWRKG